VSSFFIDSVPSVSISIVAWLTAAAVLAPRILQTDEVSERFDPVAKAWLQTRDLMGRYRVPGWGSGWPLTRLPGSD